MADRRLTVREIAEEIGVSKDSAHAILREDLNMNRVAAKFVPKLLSPEQKDLRFDVAQDLLDTSNTDPGFLNTVITGDESGVLEQHINKNYFYLLSHSVFRANKKWVTTGIYESYEAAIALVVASGDD
ncbi:HTH_48 domain-containing protein [Nephila pilipes]|uniref:HTH_48 domain-containing protein n=1 Tax=Nephila pilipes TaxID=299642 RepID=A0A8X6QK43_NEPPI|nr:HTH_48 domain-containing protein [Nephila pilipes]